MPVETILRLARTIRWASACSLTRNARAICGVVETDDGAQGERQPGLGREGRVAAREEKREPVVGGRYVVIGARATVSTSRWVARSRRPLARSRSMALRWAAVDSQAPGRSGVPSRRQTASASTTAPCTASSATSKSPKRR